MIAGGVEGIQWGEDFIEIVTDVAERDVAGGERERCCVFGIGAFNAVVWAE